MSAKSGTDKKLDNLLSLNLVWNKENISLPKFAFNHNNLRNKK